jgi:hypothetical protein
VSHAALPFELAHRQIERPGEIQPVEGQALKQAREQPFARAAQHLARPGHVAEHRARQHVQHRAVVQRFEPPDGQDRRPHGVECPAQCQRGGGNQA